MDIDKLIIDPLFKREPSLHLLLLKCNTFLYFFIVDSNGDGTLIVQNIQNNLTYYRLQVVSCRDQRYWSRLGHMQNLA
jgi:hypothetical protein